MFRITAVLCTLLIATVAYAADDAGYLEAVKLAKSKAEAKINEAITTVQDEMKKFVPDKNNLHEKLHDEIIKFTADGWNDIIAIRAKISEKVANATEDVEQSKFQECVKVVDELQNLRDTAVAKLDECAWNKSEQQKTFKTASEIVFNERIRELNKIKETPQKCDFNVSDRVTASSAMICMRSVGTTANWEASKFLTLLSMRSTVEIKKLIEGCSITTNFPNLKAGIETVLAKCNGFVDGK